MRNTSLLLVFPSTWRVFQRCQAPGLPRPLPHSHTAYLTGNSLSNWQAWKEDPGKQSQHLPSLFPLRNSCPHVLLHFSVGQFSQGEPAQSRTGGKLSEFVCIWGSLLRSPHSPRQSTFSHLSFLPVIRVIFSFFVLHLLTHVSYFLTHEEFEWVGRVQFITFPKLPQKIAYSSTLFM